ncbi:hypothetical protein ACE2AJ_13855 [Aquihabitans daechungensis]|uniref:hypothetical protein n=1 Tax=Aquihabitans daechungensis TaxID=1052257 RepID=UPI003BA17A94
MDRAASTFLRWSGRILILLAALILVASFFLPDAVQALNPLVCPEGTELSNARYTSPGAPENEELELVCTSATYTESAAQEVLVIVGGLVAFGALALWFSTRVTQRPTTRPNVPAHH